MAGVHFLNLIRDTASSFEANGVLMDRKYLDAIEPHQTPEVEHLRSQAKDEGHHRIRAKRENRDENYLPWALICA
jgi:hypothetical protein